MVRRTFNWLMAIIGAGIILSCNPECESLPASNINLPEGPFLAGSELAMVSTPANFLEDRAIYLSMSSFDNAESMELASRFDRTSGTKIVQLPAQISDNASFWVDDPDCSGSLIPIDEATSLVDESFFVDNPLFVTPFPLLVIIPQALPSVPPGLVDAWFSPNNRDYCIWFDPRQDTLADGEVIELPSLVPGTEPGRSPIMTGSVELAADCVPDANRLYHNNPVSGILDIENNYVSFEVDRTSKGLGVESYEGRFVVPGELPLDYNIGGACTPDGKVRDKIMLVTSLKTGRQLILFRGEN